MASIVISKAKIDLLNARLRALGIDESELKETFVRGSGPGGQKINKTSVCVQLVHSPSGFQIKCQKTRSQALNRYYAKLALCEELESRNSNEKSKKQQEREKVKRQKRKRSKRAKEKVLANKKETSKKKETRKKPELD